MIKHILLHIIIIFYCISLLIIIITFILLIHKIYCQQRSLISVFISSLELQGLLMSVIRPADRPTKLPVQRKMDFESHSDVQRFDNEYMIPFGQISPLVKLEDASSGMFLRDGWMRSKIKDMVVGSGINHSKKLL